MLLAWAVSAVITFFVHGIVADEEPEDLVTLSLRSSAIAAWYAPAIILLFTLSPVGLFGSLVIVVTTSRLLILDWVPVKSDSAPPAAEWNPMPAIFAALALQFGVVAVLWKNPIPAAALFALSAAIITALVVIRSGSKPERPQPMPPSALSVALTILLAVAFSTAGLKFREYASGSGGPEYTQAPNPVSTTELPDPDTTAVGLGAGGFPGVILRPVHKPESAFLVIPPSSFLKQGEKKERPLDIPFTGEYWMYQPPFIQPPRTSVIRQGTPVELSFHTSNGTSMSMEARQKLASPIELSCCERLEIVIAQRGGFAELFLKVTLIDSQAKRSLELGAASVGLNALETLRYSIPSESEMKKFDEIRVVYRPRFGVLSRSINLAVERFLLVPRGQ